ncbi:MAG: TIGR00153 family protein [Lentisphaerae bacterium]|nr:TIGR00153 family protein [Lentisphaerota bacterium]
MKTLDQLFGRSPFEFMVDHARKVHECVNRIRPIADAMTSGDMDRLHYLQEEVSKTEYEADRMKEAIRQQLPRRFFLPVAREDILNFVRQLDKMGDGAEDFAVIATFRRLDMPADVQKDFLALVDKTVETNEALLKLAEHLAVLQKEDFEGVNADKVLEKVDEVCRLEWETDRLSQLCARRYYAADGLDPITVIILDKLCRALTNVADHAENVGKNIRLMIIRH